LRHDGSFSLPSAASALGKSFAECPDKWLSAKATLLAIFSRVVFTECGTRQSA